MSYKSNDATVVQCLKHLKTNEFTPIASSFAKLTDCPKS